MSSISQEPVALSTAVAGAKSKFGATLADKAIASLFCVVGPLSGLALYVRMEPILHVGNTWPSFCYEALVAAAMVVLIELCEGRIDGKEVPEGRVFLVWSVRILLFEVFVLAIHNLTDSNHDPRSLEDLFGYDHVIWRVFWIAGVLVLPWLLLMVLFLRTVRGARSTELQSLLGAGHGVIAAILALSVDHFLTFPDRHLSVGCMVLGFGLPGLMLPWLKPAGALRRRHAALFILFALVLCIDSVLLVHAGYVQRKGVLAYLVLGTAGSAILLGTARAIVVRQRRSGNSGSLHAYWPLVVMSIAVSSAVLAWTNARPWGLLEAGATEKQGEAGQQRREQVGQASGGETQHGKEDRVSDEGTEEPFVEKQQDAVLAQVCIAGSSSFWLSVGLLVAWSIQERCGKVGVRPVDRNPGRNGGREDNGNTKHSIKCDWGKDPRNRTAARGRKIHSRRDGA